MTTSSRQHRVLPAFLLLVALLFGSLPARSEPVRRPLERIQKVAALGSQALSWIESVFASLWQPEMTKEGMSIDPNGQPGQQGDEGVTIDPNG